MQIKQQAHPLRDAAVPPLQGSPAAFGHPCSAISEKLPVMTGWGVVGAYSAQNNASDLLILPKIADSFWVEYIQEIIQLGMIRFINPIEKSSNYGWVFG